MTLSEPLIATGWACVATHGKPHPFINQNTVRPFRSEAQECIGQAWMRRDETPEQGWRRAYRAGWRAVRVEIFTVSKRLDP